MERKMKYWVFYEHRGYAEIPESFDTYEKALDFARERCDFVMKDGSLRGVYIVYGKMLL